MSNRCPNCHAEMTGTKCPSCHMEWNFTTYMEPNFICPDCGAQFYSAGTMRFCPTCADKAASVVKERERVYWENKRAGMRSIADDIVSQILAKKSNVEG